MNYLQIKNRDISVFHAVSLRLNLKNDFSKEITLESLIHLLELSYDCLSSLDLLDLSVSLFESETASNLTDLLHVLLVEFL